MGVRILRDIDGYQCLYCSVVMIAFGPIFYDDEEPEEFLEWLVQDPRLLTDKELESKVYDWRNAKAKALEEEDGKETSIHSE